MDIPANTEARTSVYTFDRRGTLLASEKLTEERSREQERRRAEADEVPPFRFEHDPAPRAFRITAADGAVETFRDTPTRHLCVEPDPETGVLRPVVKHGRPVYLHLCREDPEAR